jgi:hypothetical protein
VSLALGVGGLLRRRGIARAGAAVELGRHVVVAALQLLVDVCHVLLLALVVIASMFHVHLMAQAMCQRLA